MYSSDGEVLPFVSARAIKYAIRQAFQERGFKVDPLYEDPQASEQLRLSDSGRPDDYIDNDLFGYMLTVGGKEIRGRSYRRHSPIAISYFKALRDTPIKSEFAARFPRGGEKESNPVPFEVEIAEFIGRLNVIIYDYVGDFTKSTTLIKEVKVNKLPNQERRERLSAFLEILLTPSYVLPRRTNSLNIPEYYVTLVCISDAGPLPIYQYLNYFSSEEGISIDTDQLNLMFSRDDIKRKVDDGHTKFYLIDYSNSLHKGKEKIPIGILEKTSIGTVINKICDFLLPTMS
jgi:CRISPR-associated autoregulator DevR family